MQQLKHIIFQNLLNEPRIQLATEKTHKFLETHQSRCQLLSEFLEMHEIFNILMKIECIWVL